MRPVPPFTEAHEALRVEMRAFVEGELRPHAPEWEAARSFPNEVFAQLAERGWLGLKYGPDADWVADAVLCEELPRAGSGGLSAGIGAHVGIATPPLATFGTEAQRERWLAPAIRGEKIAALAITEPDTGSDVAAIRTRAERVAGGWVVNGAKTFITNGVRADFYVTAVRTRPEPGHGSLSFLVIPAGDGVTARPLEKLGWHASDTAEIAFEDVAAVRTRAVRVDGGWLVSGAKTYITNGVRADFYVTAVRTGGPGHAGLSFLVLERGKGVSARALSKLGWRASDTAELAFDEVFVPEEHLLGEEGRGFYLIMANFQWERLLMALGAVGAMRRTLERAAAELGGRGQATRHRVAELATRAEAGTALTYHALRRYLAGEDAVREVTMAKLATQRTNFDLQDECLRLIGPDPELERATRDARLGPIGGGTDEIMREILARTM